MPAFCRGGQPAEANGEVQEEGGVILVHSKGPFQEGCKGEWEGQGVGTGE